MRIVYIILVTFIVYVHLLFINSFEKIYGSEMQQFHLTDFSARRSDRNIESQLSYLVINEIMFNPDGNENAREFVEILNLSEEAVFLEGFILGDGTGFDAIKPVGDSAWVVSGGSYALIMDPDYFDAGEPYSGIPANTPLFTVVDNALGSRGLSNSTAESVYLISGTGDTLSVVTYSIDCPPGHSWERIIPSGGDTISNFAPSVDVEGTPGRKNSVTISGPNPALEDGSIRFNPSRPAIGENLEVIVSCRNRGIEPVSGVEVMVWISPDIQVGRVIFPEEIEAGEVSSEASLNISFLPGGYLMFTGIVSYSENNTPTGDDTLHVNLNVPVPTGTVILNEVMAAPMDGEPEWIEVMNTGTIPVDLYNWGVIDRKSTTPGMVTDHVFICGNGYAVLAGKTLPVLLPEQAVFVQIKHFPQLNNDSDSVTLLDFIGAVADSMGYENAPENFSLERISEDFYSGVSGWDNSVDVSGATPGRKNSIVFTEAEKKKGLTLTVDPNPFSDHVTISYELPFPLARVSLYVYDRRGRLVTKFRDAEESGSVWSGTWDGRVGGSRLPAGPYILNFEVLDKRTGRMVTERKIVVIASYL